MKKIFVLFLCLINLFTFSTFGENVDNLSSNKEEKNDYLLKWDSVIASSELNIKGYNYSPSMLCDGKEETAWVEGSEDCGKGEWILFKSNKSKVISEIDIYNGYRKSQELFHNNNIPTEVKIEFSNGRTFIKHLSEDFSKVDKFIFKDGVVTNYIKITILDIEYGTCDDTCISEIKVYGKNSINNGNLNKSTDLENHKNLKSKGDLKNSLLKWNTITASSELKRKGYSYAANLVCDGKNATAWSMGKYGDGINGWIMLESSEPKIVSEIDISNGYRKSKNLYISNNKPTWVKIEFSNGRSIYASLYSNVYSTPRKIYLDEEVLTDSIKITILDVERGKSSCHHTCISEISVYGRKYEPNNENILVKSCENYNYDDKTTFILYGLNEYGEIIWEKKWSDLPLTEFCTASSARISDKGIYIEVGGQLYAIDLYTGKEIWGKVNVGSSCAPVVDSDGIIYCTGYDGPFITAVNPDGTIKWSKELKDFSCAYDILLKNDLVYVYYYDNNDSSLEHSYFPDDYYITFDKKGNIRVKN